ncbi:hypothetical protein EYF80_057767 [Liparis tanakae]|uniref:Uncharacterized protein n=1 Tax=Liparis tanakae TaxID=230148 RepID=A0A4Z2EUM8_9TELE|nr:hypothetical protein EYF80_057767 [Liparis tanakae]
MKGKRQPFSIGSVSRKMKRRPELLRSPAGKKRPRFIFTRSGAKISNERRAVRSRLRSGSGDLTVSPASGVLPAAGCTGALITAAEYEARGKTSPETSPTCVASADERPQNFVARNLRFPALANSPPLKGYPHALYASDFLFD